MEYQRLEMIQEMTAMHEWQMVHIYIYFFSNEIIDDRIFILFHLVFFKFTEESNAPDLESNATDSQASSSINTCLGQLNFEGAFDTPTVSTQSSDASVSQTTSSSTSAIRSILKKKSAPSRRSTLNVDEESMSSKRSRKDDSLSSVEEYRDILNENLSQQNQNHQLHNEVLKLHQRKLEIEIETREVDLEKAKVALKKESALADIEIKKQQKLSELEIEKMQKDLGL